ncbi:hypothetical protein IWZ03DRAFT_34515 [Phyllosticta citriasiana]|uniref:Uncharacterized protein n=1 Tax=Phyllosticta citriasiana TaxID=595635 RepID=A0ABR1L3I9_9PEZI
MRSPRGLKDEHPIGRHPSPLCLVKLAVEGVRFVAHRTRPRTSPRKHKRASDECASASGRCCGEERVRARARGRASAAGSTAGFRLFLHTYVCACLCINMCWLAGVVMGGCTRVAGVRDCRLALDLGAEREACWLTERPTGGTVPAKGVRLSIQRRWWLRYVRACVQGAAENPFFEEAPQRWRAERSQGRRQSGLRQKEDGRSIHPSRMPSSTSCPVWPL